MDSSFLAREYGPMISSLAFQFFGSTETARDAAQEAWVEIVKDLPSFRGESTVKTWVYAVAWRRMLRFKRREKETSLRHLRDHYRTLTHPAPASEVPEARCAYGMEPWIRAGGLDEAFARLGSFGSQVAAYRIHPRLMPGPNYWHAYIAAPDSLSQPAAARP